ncbi:Hypothetical protein, putative [Bodo saltans]|uniref:DDE-1 domain-containing protein n=1 Tax=Bodo saltans TaxID=75058 RepID=A0A0S4ISW5_BODSA|nr:Hypothetical protein, putative [Bodo saltans]|eukprot:CUF70078.1 Hypothetical protein, putative [Bodo saltans]
MAETADSTAPKVRKLKRSKKEYSITTRNSIIASVSDVEASGSSAHDGCSFDTLAAECRSRSVALGLVWCGTSIGIFIGKVLKAAGLSVRVPTEKKALPKDWEQACLQSIAQVKEAAARLRAPILNIDEVPLWPNEGNRRIVVERGAKVVRPRELTRLDKNRVTVFLGVMSSGEKIPLHIVVKGKAGCTRKGSLAYQYEREAFISVQEHAWSDAEVCRKAWQSWRRLGHLGKKVILLCDGFLPHREWLSIVGEKSHGYDGGEGYVGPAGITHLWQPVDVGVARQFKCRFREKADVYRMKNSTTCLSVSEIITLANEAWNSITREQVISYWVRSGYVTANGVRSASQHTWVGSDHGSTVNPDDEPLYNPLDADQPEFLGDVPVDDYSASEEEGSEASDSSDSDSDSDSSRVSTDEEELPVRGARKEQTAIEEPYPIPTMRQPLEPDMVKTNLPP